MQTESKDFWIGESGTIFWGEKDPRKPQDDESATD